jgi:hypothetical protein
MKKLASLLIYVGLATNVGAQDILFQETFEDDGSDSRYTVEGWGVYELVDIQSDLSINQDMAGPIYWARNTEVSFVGVPAPVPAKRAIMSWSNTITEDDVTDDFKAFFLDAVKWLAGDGKKVLFSPPPMNDGELVLVAILEENGYTVSEDENSSSGSGGLPPVRGSAAVDIVIMGKNVAVSRFANYKKPVLTYMASAHDDMLVSSIGTTLTTELGPVAIKASDHAAAGGRSDENEFVSGSHTFDLPGAILPTDATVVASFSRKIPYQINSLERLDAMISGQLKSIQSEFTADIADIALDTSPAGVIEFAYESYLPEEVSGSFGVRGTGKIEVKESGTYSLALGVDDGGRLRIDLDSNGFSDDDNVIVEDASGAFRYKTADVSFAKAGTYDFEWASFNSGGAFGSELALAFEKGGNAPRTVDSLEWDVIYEGEEDLLLVGEISLTAYVPDVEGETEEIPFFVALGDNVFGGGPFAGFEGEGFFAGSALNKFAMDTPVKSLEFNDPINVAGKDDLKLVFLASATYLDFETSDYLKIYVEDGGDPLVLFTAPSGNDKFFDDKNTAQGEITQLGLNLQEIVYDIPSGLDEIWLRIEANTTWWNEIVAFDNIRIISGELNQEPPTIGINRDAEGNVVVEFAGSLQVAPTVNGPWLDLDRESPATLDPGQDAQFARAVRK